MFKLDKRVFQDIDKWTVHELKAAHDEITQALLNKTRKKQIIIDWTDKSTGGLKQKDKHNL